MGAISQFLIATIGMLGAIFIALLLHLAAGFGRDFRVAAAVAIALLTLLAVRLAGSRGFRISALLAALLVAELALIAVIGWLAYGGLPRPDRFFFSWFGGTATLLALPWLLGIAIGVYVGKPRGNRSA